jgi:hypothetical protein
MDRRPRYYAIKIAVLAILLAGGWAVFAVLGDSWYQLVVAVYLAAKTSQRKAEYMYTHSHAAAASRASR